MKNVLTTFILLLTLSGCHLNYSYYASNKRISPESLLNISSEKVTFDIDDEKSVDDIKDWVSADVPSSAEISCNSGSNCLRIKSLLHNYNLQVAQMRGGSSQNKVSLVYQKVSANNCKPSQFGCSASANHIQMIADYNQFVNPMLSGYQDAARVVDVYREIF